MLYLHMIPDTGTCHAIFDTWYRTSILAMLIWYMIPDTGTYHAIFNPWYWTPALAMLYLTYDTWHRHLPCYIWHMISDTGTWHMLSPGPSTLDLILWPLTRYYYTWHLYYRAYYDYHFYGDLAWLLYCYQTSVTPELLYSWTLVLLNFCIPCTHVPCTITLVNSTVIPASGRACLMSGWWGCISRSC